MEHYTFPLFFILVAHRLDKNRIAAVGLKKSCRIALLKVIKPTFISGIITIVFGMISTHTTSTNFNKKCLKTRNY